MKNVNNKCHLSVIDTDFESELYYDFIPETRIETKWLSYDLSALIDYYLKHNLNVVYTILTFMKTREECNMGAPIKMNEQLTAYKQNIIGFDKYLPEIEKYLLLK